MKKYRFLSGNKSAQAMVEFAIALPVLLLLLYGILEAGRLLFMYSTVVTASRQAARYGSATGEGNGGVPRFQDCKGIRAAANSAGYLGPFDNITIKYDTGPGTNTTPICTSGDAPATSFTVDKVKGNRTRLVVEVTEQFNPLVRLVPFFQRNIVASSARTILYSVAIVVEQEQQEWYKEPTITTITADNPDPSEILQPVHVVVTVTGGSPTGNVIITGADSNCTAPLSGGTASCDIIFNTAGSKVITAFYEGDTDHLASSDTENHEVTLINTITTILSDLPDASVKDKPFVVIVQVLNVNGSTPIPTGTVDIDGGGSVRCTIPLSNGVGNCELTYNNLGLKTLTATYNPDATHLTSNDTEDHMVIEGTPTPTMTPTVTLIPTATIPPTATMTPTPSATPTIIPTPVASCNRVTHSSITRSGNTMNMTITNPYPFPIVMNNVTATWNDDKGHQTGNDKTLNLQSMFIGGVSIWTGDVADVSYYTIPTTAIIPAGANITITFYFHQTYDNPDGTEKIYINLLTPGCENNPIDSSK